MQRHSIKAIESPLPVEELLKRAEQGDVDCQYWAAIRYFQGEGLPEDPKKAIELCMQAAQKFDARAFALLGYCNAHGIVVKQNQKAAIRMYRFAAKKGYPPAQYSLGNFYLSGSGVRKSVRLALQWLAKAADQEMVEALVKLGDIYHEGKEVVEDEGKACVYYRKAADLGSPDGQYMYGSFLMQGSTVERNPIAAFEQLDQAAAQGHEPALEMQKYFEQFVPFNPEQEKFPSLPVDHPLPVRRRTAVTMSFLGRPCYQAMARDLYDYARQNSKDLEVALQDVAVLLNAAAEAGEPVMTFTP